MLQPDERGGRLAGHVPLRASVVVHAEDAAEAEEPEPGRAERDPDRQHEVEADVDAGRLAAGSVRDRRDLNGSGDAEVDRP